MPAAKTAAVQGLLVRLRTLTPPAHRSGWRPAQHGCMLSERWGRTSRQKNAGHEESPDAGNTLQGKHALHIQSAVEQSTRTAAAVEAIEGSAGNQSALSRAARCAAGCSSAVSTSSRSSRPSSAATRSAPSYPSSSLLCRRWAGAPSDWSSRTMSGLASRLFSRVGWVELTCALGPRRVAARGGGVSASPAC